MANKRKGTAKSKSNKKSKTTPNKYVEKMYVVPKGVTRVSYPGICPDVMRVQLRYNRYQSINAASPQVSVYRGNSVFDPDFSGVGSQPMGHDQWSAFYRRYRVIAAKIIVKFSSMAASTTGVQCVITPLNGSGSLSNPLQYLEANRSVKSSVVNDTGDSSALVSLYMTTAEIKGMPKDGYMYERDLSAANTSNPIFQWFIHVGFFDVSGGLNNINVHAQTEIVYYVEYFDREILSQS